MTTIIIALRNDIFHYTFTKELDGVVYSFRVRYNKRADNWILDIVNVVNAIRLAGGQDLLRQFKHLDVPQGELRIVDLDGLNNEPNDNNLGDRVILQYTEV